MLYQISSSYAGCTLSRAKREKITVLNSVLVAESSNSSCAKVECILLGRDDATPIMIAVTFTASCYGSEG